MHKTFEGRKLYDGLNLSIPNQKITVILGKSGVGKSILLKHILGLILPDSGRIEIAGRDIAQLSEQERRQTRLQFGMVFQHSALLDSLTVEQNVGLGLQKLTELPERDIHARVQRCLKSVGLEAAGHLLPEKLSGGMRKRAAFARAVVMNPPYLLYDEPTTGLDPTAASTISDLIIQFNRDFQTTSVVVTHDVGATLQIADRIVLLEEGKIQLECTPVQFRSSDHPLVQSFLGTSPEMMD
ncbi:MAG TPA: ATP-binding cassette domain-containing protein [bacterium]|nr:ATP-binding cassette domain-containing protein [bacterium]